MKILLIEPDKLLAKSCSQMLKKSGFEVRMCSDAQEAIHEIDKVKPDLIVLEIQLAQHNGVEFLYEMRSYPEWKNIPVIILSMIEQEDINIDYLTNHLGITKYLYKPKTKLDKLEKIIKQTLNENI